MRTAERGMILDERWLEPLLSRRGVFTCSSSGEASRGSRPCSPCASSPASSSTSSSSPPSTNSSTGRSPSSSRSAGGRAIAGSSPISLAPQAPGSRPTAAVAGALTFRGPADAERFKALLDDIKAGRAKHLVFAVPSGIVWPLPIYELALLTATELEREGLDATLLIVTSEPAPLALFGRAASEAVNELLRERGIPVHPSTYPVEVSDGLLKCVRGSDVAADGVVALPRLAGPAIEGVPRDRNGFVPTDPHGRVAGAADVYAAGDLTAFPIKQGGLAAEQADAAAEAIAAAAGVAIEPTPFRPVLRALLLTGRRPTFLQVELGGGHGETSRASQKRLWRQPGKIVGRRLAPFLAGLGLVDTPTEPQEADVLRIEADAAALHELLLPRA